MLLGGGAWLEEVGRWGHDLEGGILIPGLFHSLWRFLTLAAS